MIFLGSSFALTVRHGANDPTVEAARRLVEQPDMPQLGPVSVLHAVTDVVVDAYEQAAAQVRTDLTELEKRVFSPAREDRPDRGDLLPQT
ncbi:CorA family divalent cation transporter [Streptomyces libani]|uniref:CorA family divalent cation transporter n=1 Tax=Streptomyces nigrescens TaxID=1920 RepID=UPI0037FD4385